MSLKQNIIFTSIPDYVPETETVRCGSETRPKPRGAAPKSLAET